MMNSSRLIQFKHVIIDAKGPGNPHIKAVGDIDGDGFIDVVVASSNGGPLVWYEYPDIGNKGRLDIVGANWSGDYQPVEMWKQGGQR